MKLIDGWKKVAQRAWSFRLAALAGSLSAAEVVLPMFSDALPRGVFATLSVAAGIGSAISRVVAQPEMHK